MYNPTTINAIALAIKNEYCWLDFDLTAGSFVRKQVTDKVMGQGLPLSVAQIRTVGKKGNMKGMSSPGWIRLRIYN